jgi:hypothetical protein
MAFTDNDIEVDNACNAVAVLADVSFTASTPPFTVSCKLFSQHQLLLYITLIILLVNKPTSPNRSH